MINKVRRWTQEVFPNHNEEYFIRGYVSSYIDELMSDMGLETRRTDNLFKEYIGPARGIAIPLTLPM